MFETCNAAIIANSIGNEGKYIIGFGVDQEAALYDAAFRTGCSPAFIVEGYNGAELRECTPAAAWALGYIKHLPGPVALKHADGMAHFPDSVFHINTAGYLDFTCNASDRKELTAIRKRLLKYLRTDPELVQTEYARAFHERTKDARAIYAEANMLMSDQLQFNWGLDLPAFTSPKTYQQVVKKPTQLPERTDYFLEPESNIEAHLLGIEPHYANIIAKAVLAEKFAMLKALEHYKNMLREQTRAYMTLATHAAIVANNDDVPVEIDLTEQIQLIMNQFTGYQRWSVEASANRARQLVLRDMFEMGGIEQDSV